MNWRSKCYLPGSILCTQTGNYSKIRIIEKEAQILPSSKKKMFTIQMQKRVEKKKKTQK